MVLALSCLSFVLFLGWLYERRKRELAALKGEWQNQEIIRLSLVEQERERIEKELYVLRERFAQTEHFEEKVKGMLSTLSLDALEKNSRSFLDLAKLSMEKFQEEAKGDLAKKQQDVEKNFIPVKEVLHKLDEGLNRIDRDRRAESVRLQEQIKVLQEGGQKLSQETASLVQALRAPRVRGRWGEVQLRRVVELAGMLNHCDFFEQMQEEGEDRALRPDLIVRLPGGRQVIIDAKVPLESYLEALNGEEEKKKLLLASHAKQVRAHVVSLGKKGYWSHFQPTPEFVVLFLPAEPFFSAALEEDPSLIEFAAEQNVILATPTTLIALLRAVAYGWRQENLSLQVEALHNLGQEIYKRLFDMASHFSKMGRGLSSAVESYNKGIGSFETRVLVTARKFKEMGVAPQSIELEEVERVEKVIRDSISLPP